MNKVYKLVWSKVRNCYVAVSELAKSRAKAPGRSGTGRCVAAGVLACVLSCGAVMPVMAAGTDNGYVTSSDGYAAGTVPIVTGKGSIAIGTHAVATGNNLTWEQLKAKLDQYNIKKDNHDDLSSQVAQNTIDRANAQGAYDEAATAAAAVQAARNAQAGYQSQLDNYNSQKVNTDATYDTAKSEYEALYNDFKNRLNYVKAINFNLYSYGDGTYNLDAMALDLKNNTEAGTTYNMPVSFYRNYIDKYIVLSGDSRKLGNLASVIRYRKNGGCSFSSYGEYGILDGDSILDKNRIKILTGKKYGYNENDMTFIVSDGRIVREDTSNYITLMGVNGKDAFFSDLINSSAISDDVKNVAYANLDTVVNERIGVMSDFCNDLVLSGYYSDSEKNKYMNFISSYFNNTKNIMKKMFDYSNLQYKYEQTHNLSYLSAKEALLLDIEHLIKNPDNEFYFSNAGIKRDSNGKFVLYDTSSGYIQNIPYFFRVFDDIKGGLGFDGLTPEQSLAKYLYENYTSVIDTVNTTLTQVSDSLEGQLAAKKQAYDNAAAAKKSVDDKISRLTKIIGNLEPTAEQKALANQLDAKARALQQAKDKFNADEAALKQAYQDMLNSEVGTVGEGAIAIGDNVITTGKNAIGQGTGTIVAGEEAVGIGNQNIISAKQAVGVGSQNSVSGEESLAVGHNNGVTGTQSLAVGTGHIVKGNHSGAIGDPNIVNGDNSYAVGNNSTIAEGTSDVFVFGNNVNATASDVVALGTGSDASEEHTVSVGSSTQKRRIVNVEAGTADNDAVNVKQLRDALADVDVDIDANGVIARNNTGLVSGGIVYNEVRPASDGTYVKVGNTVAQNLAVLDGQLKTVSDKVMDNVVQYDTTDRDLATLRGTHGTKLTNLKQASLSASSTDAVIGAQLHATNQNIAGFAADIRKNKDNITALNSSVTAALETVSVTSTLVNTIDNLKADASLNNLTTAGKQVILNAAANAVQEYMAAHHGHEKPVSDPSASLMRVEGSRSVSSLIDDLADGDSSSLDKTVPVSDSVSGMKLKIDSAGSANFVVYDDDSSSKVTLEGASGTKVTGLAAGEVSEGSTDAVNGSQLYGVSQQVNGKAALDYVNEQLGLKVDKTDVYTKQEADSLLAGKADKTYVDTGLSQKADIGYVDAGFAEKADKSYVDNSLELKADKSYVEQNLSRKADRDSVYTKDETDSFLSKKADREAVYSRTEADALFVGQAAMKEVMARKADADAKNVDVEAWSSKLGTGKIVEGDTGLVKGGAVYDALQVLEARHGVAEADYLDGQIRLGGRPVYDSMDVVNISKSDGSGRVMTGVVTNPEDMSSAANVGYVNAIGRQVADTLHGSISQMNDRVDKVGANAAALASLLPPSFDGDEKWAVSAAVGNYKSATAGAVGLFYRPQDNVTMNLRGSFGSEENMLGGGVTVSLNRGNTPGVSKAQLVRAVNAQAQEIQNMRSEREADKAEIAELKAQMSEMAKALKVQKASE